MYSNNKQIFLVYIFSVFLSSPYFLQSQKKEVIRRAKLLFNELGEMYKDPPVLVLDDVFAELDPSRQFLLLEAVGTVNQCFISATHLDDFGGNWKKNSQIIELKSQFDGILEVG